MKSKSDRVSCAVLLRAGAATLAIIAIGGCASQAAVDRPPGPTKAEREAASQLYTGEPTVVHATEFPVVSAAEGITRGDEAWRQGKLDLAAYLYIQSLAFQPDNPVPFLKIGAIHESRGNRALAALAFERALQLDPDNAGANERLGLLYLQDGRNDDARKQLERAIELDPSRWQSHNGLGIVADRNGDSAAAIEHYDVALELVPRAPMIVNNRGYSRYLAGNFTGAEADFRLALQMSPLAGTWTNLGRAQARQNRYSDALESFLKEHDEANARNLLGEVAMEGGDFDTAQSEFTLALSAAPRFFQAAHDNLELVAKRIAERKMPVVPVGGSATAASALPVGTATVVAESVAWNSNRSQASN
jgi:Flp pilus assembly protein TadD